MKLATSIMKRRNDLERLRREMISETQDEFFTEKQFLALVLLYEYAFGCGLKKSHRLKKLLLKHKKILTSKIDPLVAEMKRSGELDEDATKMCKVPRYVRINTLKTSTDEVLKTLLTDGWLKLSTGNLLTQEQYMQKVRSLVNCEFLVDKHIPSILTFPPGTELHKNELVVAGKLILQDKSSCFPPMLLRARPGAKVLDICAAPGLKTSQIAAQMQNKGIISVDLNEERVATMKNLLNLYGIECCEVLCSDFLALDMASDQFSDVTHALVDPPCSGSGIYSRNEAYADRQSSMTPMRLDRLGNLQAMILKRALSICTLQRLVYSTCSTFERENEAVVQEVLDEYSDYYHLEYAFPQWTHRGMESYSFGKCCLRFSEEDLTNGFFIAVFVSNEVTNDI
ncbi:unnamed protein product [Soboliphyme baturini]|uniref:SAM_MT_RSMB_NOP domain-containing protein n=1 Tax=Soboliphyme baturini TaxID=241478 RepID=A0A183IUL3_9BILA|nr:unnamed protein product [Soboliphyme baturini]